MFSATACACRDANDVRSNHPLDATQASSLAAGGDGATSCDQRPVTRRYDESSRRQGQQAPRSDGPRSGAVPRPWPRARRSHRRPARVASGAEGHAGRTPVRGAPRRCARKGGLPERGAQPGALLGRGRDAAVRALALQRPPALLRLHHLLGGADRRARRPAGGRRQPERRGVGRSRRWRRRSRRRPCAGSPS